MIKIIVILKKIALILINKKMSKTLDIIAFNVYLHKNFKVTL